MIAATDDPNKRSLHDRAHMSRAAHAVGREGVLRKLAKVIARHRSSWHENFLCPQRKERPGKWLGETGL
jgi:hypothetical protein